MKDTLMQACLFLLLFFKQACSKNKHAMRHSATFYQSLLKNYTAMLQYMIFILFLQCCCMFLSSVIHLLLVLRVQTVTTLEGPMGQRGSARESLLFHEATSVWHSRSLEPFQFV